MFFKAANTATPNTSSPDKAVHGKNAGLIPTKLNLSKLKKEAQPFTVAGQSVVQKDFGEKNLKLQQSIQPKLTIGTPDDPYEREADAVADQVMRMPETDFIQRKCSQCEEENISRKPLTQTISTFFQTQIGGHDSKSNEVAIGINSSRGGGSALDGQTQSFMSSRFGSNFNDVKIHTDSKAVQLNRDLNAKAFTVGKDVFFNQGQYQPGSPDGKKLLAHELTHVMQQGNGKGLDTIQRRISRQHYSTAAYERGPVWEVSLTIDGAPATETASFQEFQDACMDGIMGAARTLGNGSGATSRRLIVRLRFQRQFDYSTINQQAYRLALQSVLPAQAPSPVPAPSTPPPSATHQPESAPSATPQVAPAAPQVAPATPQDCSPSGSINTAEGCTINPHGAHLPPVGGTHTEAHPFQPCLLNRAEVASSPNWCVDAQQAHGGEVCYRQIPTVSGGPGDQYCYSENCCHNSADAVSVVDPTSPGNNSCCQSNYGSYPGHIWEDVVPEFMDDPGRVFKDIFGL